MDILPFDNEKVVQKNDYECQIDCVAMLSKCMTRNALIELYGRSMGNWDTLKVLGLDYNIARPHGIDYKNYFSVLEVVDYGLMCFESPIKEVDPDKYDRVMGDVPDSQEELYHAVIVHREPGQLWTEAQIIDPREEPYFETLQEFNDQKEYENDYEMNWGWLLRHNEE